MNLKQKLFPAWPMNEPAPPNIYLGYALAFTVIFSLVSVIFE